MSKNKPTPRRVVICSEEEATRLGQSVKSIRFWVAGFKASGKDVFNDEPLRQIQIMFSDALYLKTKKESAK
jgi:hypothetical protein